jgi:hypothetical protein
MSIKVALEHRTTYDFAEPVAVALRQRLPRH